MSENYLLDLIKYRLDRAKETLAEAILLQQQYHLYKYANRLYCVCFYALMTLFEKHAPKFSKHGGEIKFPNSFLLMRMIKVAAEEQANLSGRQESVTTVTRVNHSAA